VIIDYTFLLLAVVLLWFPRQWLRFGRAAVRRLRWWPRARRRSVPGAVREPGDTRLKAGEEFAKPRNYIDFFRALVGGLLLVGNAAWAIEPALRVDPAATLGGQEGALLGWVRMALLLIAVLIQFIRYENRFTLYAPIFFLGGLGIALCGLHAGMLAVLTVWVMNASLPLTPAGFLSVYALLVFMLGLLFRGAADANVIFAGTVSLLPVVISLLSRRSLAVFTKKSK
jgi:hypothetical protein